MRVIPRPPAPLRPPPPRPVVRARATPPDDAAAAAAPPPFKLRLPVDPADQCAQAAAALLRAHAGGATRASVRLLLVPANPSDLDDWPGGVREQGVVALPLVEKMLATLKKEPALQGPLDAAVLDRADAVGAWTGPTLAAIMFPTAEILKTAVAYAEARDAVGGLTFLVNPAWTMGGNIINDFGVGYWRAAAEKKVASFRLAYALDALRVGGDDVRLLYLEGAGWSVWRLDENAPTAGTLLAEGLADRPPYDQLTELLRATPGSASAAPLLERLKREIKFIQDSANQG